MYNSEIRIFAAFVSEGMSLRRHLEEHTQALAICQCAPFAPVGRLRGQDLQIKSETHRTAQEILSGEWASISKPWEIRRDAMLDILVKAAPFTFKPIVQIDPANTLPLSQALNGRFYEKAKPRRKTITSSTRLLFYLPGWSCGKRSQRTPSRGCCRQAGCLFDAPMLFCDIRPAWPKSTPSPKPPNILASAARRKAKSVKGIAKEG